MAIPATAVAEVRSDGNDANGAFFVSSYGGTDYSQQASAQLTGTTGACTASTTTFTATENAFTPQMVGNGLYISSGTNATVGYYIITAYTSSSQIDLDRTCAPVSNASSVAYKIGGAAAGPGIVASAAVTGNTIWIRGGSDPETNFYTTSGTANVSGGRVNITTTGIRIVGYLTTRGDCTIGGSRPVIKAGASNPPITLATGNVIESVIVDGVKATYTTVPLSITGSVALNVTARNGASGGFEAASSSCSNCCASGNNGAYGFNVRSADHCIAKDNLNLGFQFATNGGTGSNLTAHSNGTDGIRITASGVTLDSCLSTNNTSDGLDMSTASSVAVVTNSVFAANGAYGINVSGSNSRVIGRNNAYRANSTAATNGTVNDTGAITLSGDPYTNSGSDDYTVVAGSAGGLQLKGAGIATNADGTSIGAPDIGHYQQPAGGGVSAARIVNQT